MIKINDFERQKKFDVMVRNTTAQRKVYLRGPSSHTLTIPSEYCQVLGIHINDQVELKLIKHNNVEGLFVRLLNI